jgi:ATP-dependent DNA ligase
LYGRSTAAGTLRPIPAELEGVVAKKVNEPYLCGERAWVKVKNRAYWRYELEREGALRWRSRKVTSADK